MRGRETFRSLQAEVTHLGNLLGQFHNHSHSVECLTNTHLDGQSLGRLRFVCKNKKKKEAINSPRREQLETLLFISAQNPKVNLRLAVGGTTPPPLPWVSQCVTMSFRDAIKGFALPSPWQPPRPPPPPPLHS